MIIYLSLVFFCIAGYFHYIACKPILHKYSENNYCIRLNNKYLDIQSYVRFKTIIWKSSTHQLMKCRCVSDNINLLQDILNEL